MYILNLLGNCGNPALANLFNIAQRFITVIQIIAPILAIIALGINLTKSVINPEDKKNFSMYKNWLIAIVMVFAIPTLVNATMGMLGEDYSISACWNNASNASTRGESTYKPVNNKKPSGGINTIQILMIKDLLEILIKIIIVIIVQILIIIPIPIVIQV